jgi:hypothetical protein
MGIIRWTGRQLAKPVTLRANAFRDIWSGVQSGKRAVARTLPGRKQHHPPLLPGTAGASVETIYARWSRLSYQQRQAAWVEHKSAVPVFMRLSAEQSEHDWSLNVEGQRREKRYRDTQKALTKSLLIYSAMMALPLVFVVKNGGDPIFWVNLVAAALLLAPGPIRLIILRAQLFHGGKVSIPQLFRRYPRRINTGASSREEGQPTSEAAAVQSYPLLSYLYGLTNDAEYRA